MLAGGLRRYSVALLSFGAALVAAAVLSFRPVADSDTGWHLAIGRLISGGHFPRTNALAWTQPDHPFYPTSWLFDLAGFQLHEAFGVAGLQLLTFLCVAVALGAVASICVREGHAPWLVLPIALLLADRIVPRPHVASWAVLAVCVALCVAGEAKSWRWRAACVLPIALGSNLHAGAVFASVAVGLFCLAEAIRERSVRGVVREGLVAVAAVTALTANPGGTYNISYAIAHLSMTDTLMLTEFERPDLSNAPGFFVVAPLGVVAALLMFRKRPGIAAVALTFIVGGIFAVRLAFKFYLAAAPVITAGIGALEARYGERVERYAALLVLGAALVSTAPVFSSLRLGARFDEQWIPVRAVEFIKTAKLDGKVWTGFNDGGYVEWALPEVPAYQDARVLAYDAAFFKEQQAAQSSPDDFVRYLETRGVEWALTTNLPGDLSGSGLIRHERWALVYWDDLSEVYVRRDVPRFAEVVRAFEYRELSPWEPPVELVARIHSADEARVVALESELARFEGASPRHPAGRLTRCAVATRLGRPDAMAACDEARGLFQTEEMRALVDRAASAHARPGG